MPGLLISVRLHEGRYHGAGDWPPSPARLFQALVAGAASGAKLPEKFVEALVWLEREKPPLIAAPAVRLGQAVSAFVPNNDLDAHGGDPARVSEIRVGKVIRPRHFDPAMPILYLWRFSPEANAERHAHEVCEGAAKLYQLGRGVDFAWAQGEVVDDGEADATLSAYRGHTWSPNNGGDGFTLLCPDNGSMKSLAGRFDALRERFRIVGEGKRKMQQFAQPPKPYFRQVAYNIPQTFLLFDIRSDHDNGRFASEATERVVKLTENTRNLAAGRLKRALPNEVSLIDRVFICSDATEADKAQRIRITPLPSIGHQHTDSSIRRLLIEVPSDCPISAADIAWAFSNLDLVDPDTGEISGLLVAADDRGMLRHYGIGTEERWRVWRTVTPAALPQRAARRRIEPRQIQQEAKGGAERLREEAAAGSAVRQALRRAGVTAAVESVRLQREPFDAKGDRAEAFAPGTRFTKERLWHVEISFARPVQGPLLIGDGRYLGLGLMAPVRQTEGVFAFEIADGLADDAEPLELTRALRRAIMSRVQAQLGPRATLPVFFTGHSADGAPARSGGHEHLAFAFDAPRRRLIVLSPHVLEKRAANRNERRWLAVLEQALEDFAELRAGRAGKLTITPCAADFDVDPLFGMSSIWASVTPYRVTRHAKLKNAAAAVEDDLLAECRRCGLPRPQVKIERAAAKPGDGLFGHVSLRFHCAVNGPLLLGRDRHFGGGLFAAAD